jgi:hypothetical protein
VGGAVIERDAIPVELRERDQWVVWKYEKRRTKQGSEKWTKVPYRAVSPRTKATSDDPRTWGTFEQAMAANPAEIHGYGFVFSVDDPFAGGDLDACIDSQTGQLHPAADEILTELGGYQERSPSGVGIHAIVIGKLSGSGRRTKRTPWGGEFEVYDQGRYFTITGNGAGGIVERQAQLDTVVVRMFGKQSAPSARAVTIESPADGGGPARGVDELITAFPKLGKLVRHEGEPPKQDPSDSGWDYWLACESCRSGLTVVEFGALIRVARPGGRKAKRQRYIEKTFENACESVADRENAYAALAEFIRGRREERGR